MKWGLCLLDLGWHAIDDHRDHLPGVLEAECGHLLPMVALHDEPSGLPCEACAAPQLARAVTRWQDDQIPGRPPVEPAPEHPAPRGRPGPRGRRVKAIGHAR